MVALERKKMTSLPTIAYIPLEIHFLIAEYTRYYGYLSGPAYYVWALYPLVKYGCYPHAPRILMRHYAMHAYFRNLTLSKAIFDSISKEYEKNPDKPILRGSFLSSVERRLVIKNYQSETAVWANRVLGQNQKDIVYLCGFCGTSEGMELRFPFASTDAQKAGEFIADHLGFKFQFGVHDSCLTARLLRANRGVETDVVLLRSSDSELPDKWYTIDHKKLVLLSQEKKVRIYLEKFRDIISKALLPCLSTAIDEIIPHIDFPRRLHDILQSTGKLDIIGNNFVCELLDHANHNTGMPDAPPSLNGPNEGLTRLSLYGYKALSALHRIAAELNRLATMPTFRLQAQFERYYYEKNRKALKVWEKLDLPLRLQDPEWLVVLCLEFEESSLKLSALGYKCHTKDFPNIVAVICRFQDVITSTEKWIHNGKPLHFSATRSDFDARMRIAKQVLNI